MHLVGGIVAAKRLRQIKEHIEQVYLIGCLRLAIERDSILNVWFWCSNIEVSRH